MKKIKLAFIVTLIIGVTMFLMSSCCDCKHNDGKSTFKAAQYSIGAGKELAADLVTVRVDSSFVPGNIVHTRPLEAGEVTQWVRLKYKVHE